MLLSSATTPTLWSDTNYKFRRSFHANLPACSLLGACNKAKIISPFVHEHTLQQGVQKCDSFWFIHILSCRFNPIRSQLETFLNFWLVNFGMTECEFITGDHAFMLLAVTTVQETWLELQCQVIIKNNYNNRSIFHKINVHIPCYIWVVF